MCRPGVSSWLPQIETGRHLLSNWDFIYFIIGREEVTRMRRCKCARPRTGYCYLYTLGGISEEQLLIEPPGALAPCYQGLTVKVGALKPQR